MTNGGGAFSPEEIKYLKSLPAVADVTAKRITYSEAFKRYCLRRYHEGASPVRLFREAGLDPALIGNKRVERCFARWRKSEASLMSDSTLGNNLSGGGGIHFRPFRGRRRRGGCFQCQSGPACHHHAVGRWQGSRRSA